jgi:hypothetical protein
MLLGYRFVAYLTQPDRETRIRHCFVETLSNRDMFGAFPSDDSITRHLPSLHWVLRGSFPSFTGNMGCSDFLGTRHETEFYAR